LGKIAHCEKTFPLSFGGARLDGSTATLDGHGEKVHDHFFGQSSFGTYALANERNVVKVTVAYRSNASVRSAAVFKPEPGP